MLSHPDLLVGSATGDDAAVWKMSDDRAIVATVDFFTPLVDDARTWGAIAAANSASDVYAMGGTPLFALNVAAWPRDTLPLDVLADVLAGASDKAAEGGWLIVGGHTVDGPEPMFGQTVIGEVNPANIMTNDAARVGDVLVLTKPLGTGVIATAMKRQEATAIEPGGQLHDAATAAIASMSRLNKSASQVAVRYGVRAATDVTGFGLLGHLHKMALGSATAMRIDVDNLPIIAGVSTLIEAGFVPGGSQRNAEFVQEFVGGDLKHWIEHQPILVDPQTSGGLVLCVQPDHVADVCRELIEGGDLAVVIGEVVAGSAGHIVLA
jgi:selenide, water dikinase